MAFVETLLIAVGLAMDAFAVSLAAGAAGWADRPRARFRLWFHFGLFQALMPVAGWLAGARVAALVAAWDHWLAFALLAWIGARMIRGGLRGGETHSRSGPDPTRGRTLLGLAVATSIDALAVGFSFACLGLEVWRPALVIGAVAAAFSLAGCLLGHRLGVAVGRRLEVAGGAALVLVGLKIVVEHLGG
ncbi:MAG TPA: manganese efflux pump MntP family protein [Candidatus Krumholzibacteria bacterium]|nr:manganese efflux pump MntP family protein [Candidatus Krumholzibacteria bacterium]HPD72374.1 manganese efflux pump MntP family protein [Candidatus Krumholzibacteria bacterium]HRY40694.1 manganese efflux pump MntP family protein [Candidatus Krumholzibacteria bacterium]